jgi:hypothetical protein
MNGVEKGSSGKIFFPLKAFLLNEGRGVNAFPNIKKPLKKTLGRGIIRGYGGGKITWVLLISCLQIKVFLA